MINHLQSNLHQVQAQPQSKVPGYTLIIFLRFCNLSSIGQCKKISRKLRLQTLAPRPRTIKNHGFPMYGLRNKLVYLFKLVCLLKAVKWTKEKTLAYYEICQFPVNYDPRCFIVQAPVENSKNYFVYETLLDNKLKKVVLVVILRQSSWQDKIRPIEISNY
jgi:hypothetical protein